MVYTGLENRNESVPPQTKPPTSNTYINGAKVSLARWFYQRIFVKKTTSPPQKPDVNQTNENVSSNDAPSRPDNEGSKKSSSVRKDIVTPGCISGELSSLVKELIEETPFTVVVLGPPSSGKTQLVNSVLQATCISQEEYSQKNDASWVFVPPVFAPSSTNKSKPAQNVRAGPNPHNSAMIETEEDSFLLPEGLKGNGGKPILILYGETVELLITFYQNSELPSDVSSKFKAFQPYLGKTVQIQGPTKFLEEDLKYCLKKLKDLQSEYGAVIREIKLRVPSTMLKSNKTIIEISDTYSANNSSALKVVGSAHLLIITHDHTGMTSNLKKTLKDSGFLQKLAEQPRMHKILFVDNSEQSRKPSVPALDVFASFLQDEGMSPEKIVAMGSSISSISIKPQLFNSLCKASPSLSKDTLSEICSNTNIPLLVATIENLTISLTAESLTPLNEKWVEMTPEGPPASPVSQSSNSVKKACTQAKHTPTQLEGLKNVTPENMKLWQQQLMAHFDDMSTPDSEPHFQADQMWHNVMLPQINGKVEEILSTSSNLFRECLSKIEHPENPSTLHKLRLKKLYEFCNKVHQRTEERIKAFRELLPPEDRDDTTAPNEPRSSQIQEKVQQVMGDGIPLLISLSKDLDSSAVKIIDALNCTPGLSSQPTKTKSILKAESPQSLTQTPQGDDDESFSDSYKQQLENANLVHHEISSLPSSQLRALAHQVYGSQDAHLLVRILVLSEILAHPARYESFVKFSPLKNLQLYVQYLANENSPGDQLTLSAFSNFYGADLLIYGPMFSRPLLIETINRKTDKVYCISVLPNKQYVSLIYKAKVPLAQRRPLEDPYSPPSKKRRHYHDHDPTPSDPTPSPMIVDHQHVANNCPAATDTPAEMEIENPRDKIVGRKQVDTLVKLCCERLILNGTEQQWISAGETLPEDLIHDCLQLVVTNFKLDSPWLPHIVTDRLSSLTLNSTFQLTDEVCRRLSPGCSNIKNLSVEGCSRLTSEGLCSLVSSCSFLESINIGGCINITDSFLDFLEKDISSNLVSLNLRGCIKLSEERISSFLKNCKMLASLSLRELPVSDQVLNSLPNSLEELDLTDCARCFTSGIVTVGDHCPSLRKLLIGSSSYRPQTSTQTLLKLSTCFQKLEELDLTGHDQTTDAVLEGFTRHNVSLHSLILAGCKSLTRLPPSLSTNLRMIDLSRCFHINDSALETLALKSRLLKSLNLSGCEEFSTEGIRAVARASPKLKELNLSSCSCVSDEAVEAIAWNCPLLAKMNLYNCCRITDKAIQMLSLHCKRLITLDVSSCDLITDKALEYLSSCECAKVLRALCLEETQITDKGISCLAQSCHSLTHLKLAHCRSLSDETLRRLSIGCPLLSSLDLSYCNGIKLSALHFALSQWKDLRHLSLRGYVGLPSGCFSLSLKSVVSLDVSWCKQLNDDSLESLSLACPNMKDLDLAWCGMISAKAVNSLSSNCPNLKNLNLRGCSLVSSLSSTPHLRVFR
jgi:F-box/leucine-rich repeat protein 2/20